MAKGNTWKTGRVWCHFSFLMRMITRSSNKAFYVRFTQCSHEHCLLMLSDWCIEWPFAEGINKIIIVDGSVVNEYGKRKYVKNRAGLMPSFVFDAIALHFYCLTLDNVMTEDYHKAWNFKYQYLVFLLPTVTHILLLWTTLRQRTIFSEV